MNFRNLKSLSRGMVPSAKPNVISNTRRNLILQEGVYDVARLTRCLPTNETFNVVADQAEYNLTTVLTRFLVIDRPGLWWYDGSDWKKVDPTTMIALDNDYPNWRDDESSDPSLYCIEGDTLIIKPPPDTSGTDYFKMYFCQKPESMSSDSDYPFGHATEIARLSILSNAILLYWRKMALRIVGKAGKSEYLVADKEYYSEIARVKALLNERVDISASEDVRMQGKKVR